ncbi:C1q-like domain-containing protein [Spirosoma koreense]
MNKSLLSKTLLATATIVALFSASSSVFAQVKIGTNPTIIGANNNLEVEASTTGRKTTVDKTTGQVTIADGTQGTGKVFTSDAVGGGSWQNVKLTAFAGAVTQVRQTMTTSSLPSIYTPVVFQAETTDPTNAFTPSTGTFVAPVTGLYQVFGSTQFDNNAISATPPAFSQTCLKILVNGTTNVAQACSQINAVTSSASVSNLVLLNAGDAVVLTAAATAGASTTFQVVVSSFYAYKISD